MNNEAMMNRTKQLVVDYFNAHVDVTDGKKLTMEDVFIVWFCLCALCIRHFSHI